MDPVNLSGKRPLWFLCLLPLMQSGSIFCYMNLLRSSCEGTGTKDVNKTEVEEKSMEIVLPNRNTENKCFRVLERELN